MDCLPEGLTAQEVFEAGFKAGMKARSSQRVLIDLLRGGRRGPGRPPGAVDPASAEWQTVALINEYPNYKQTFLIRWCYFHFVRGVPASKVGAMRLRGHLPSTDRKGLKRFSDRVRRRIKNDALIQNN